MDMKEVYQLIEKFEHSSLWELSLELGGVKLAVKKGGAAASNVTWNSNAATCETVPTSSPAKESAVANKEMETADVAQKVITAPLVGTFYRAPGPDEKPFIEVGQQVKKGDVVAIVEAMKVMNEIVATEDGVVTSIEAEDESLVEYGEVLIRLS
ncbi:MAG: acetyl-CoA carboxylase biotin carboxyl carrier protein [Roseburia sp.]|nr:acetyl-CoA carboxylase biotin carboxyl carrier protein [Roseburia sp.]